MQSFLLAIIFIFIFFFLIIHFVGWEDCLGVLFMLIMLSVLFSIYSIDFLSCSWMGLSLFLVYVGGLMVLFLITTSLMEKKSFISMKLNFSFFFVFMFYFFMSFSNNLELSNVFTFENEKESIFLLILFLNIVLYSMSKLIYSPLKSLKSFNLKLSSCNMWFRIMSLIFQMSDYFYLDTMSLSFSRSLLNFPFLVMLSFMLLLLLLLVNFFLESKKNYSKNSKSNVECGFDSNLKTKFNFCNQFFMIAIIFLIFDMEIIIIMPLPISILELTSKLFFFILILILILSLLMEWVSGLLEWTK